MDEFFKTHMGRKFFDGDFPKLVSNLGRIADALEKSEAVEVPIHWIESEEIKYFKELAQRVILGESWTQEETDSVFPESEGWYNEGDGWRQR